ncbi:unnamed protein product [Closterium sp. Naga37s-1]|nr:unnamed protein product [Closterium sp. Naga37s-1]
MSLTLDRPMRDRKPPAHLNGTDFVVTTVRTRALDSKWVEESERTRVLVCGDSPKSGDTEHGGPRSTECGPEAWLKYNEVLFTVQHSSCSEEPDEDDEGTESSSCDSEDQSGDADWVASETESEGETDNTPPPSHQSELAGTGGCGQSASGRAGKRLRATGSGSNRSRCDANTSVLRRVVAVSTRASGMRRNFFNIYEETSDVDIPSATGQSANVARGEPSTTETRVHDKKLQPSLTTAAAGHGGYRATSTPTPTTPLNRSQDVVRGSAFSGNSARPSPLTPTTTLKHSGVEAESNAAPSRGGGVVNRTLFASPPRMHPSKTAGSPSNITPATPLVAPSPQVHDRGPDGAGVLPGMIPTPFLDTCEDTHASVRGADTVLGGDGCRDDVAGRAMEQIRLLWAEVQATRGTKSPTAAAQGGVMNFTLGEDLQAALAGMDGEAAEESGKGGGVVTPAVAAQPQVWRPGGRTGDAPQQSGVRRDASVATQAPTRPPGRAAKELAPVAEAFERPNRGFAMNRLSGAGRLAVVGNHVATRVGGVGVGTETGRAAGSVAPDGVVWDRHASGMQGRGLKRERSKMTIVVDYNPNDDRPDLQPGMPSADQIHFYAKKAMHLLLRSCAAHGVTYWPTDDERNVALLVVLRCHYEVFVGGFRWGAEHLYVNESDLEEFKPVQYGGKMDPGGDTDEPWYA